MLENQGPSSSDSILTEEASLQFGTRDLNIARLRTSELADLKIEAQGINLTALLGRLRNWIRQPNQVRGRVDQIDKTYHVFAEWKEPSGKGLEIQDQFHNRSHSSLQEAGFQIAAKLLWQEIHSLADPPALARSLVTGLSEDDFVTFLEAWSVYRIPEKDQKTRKAALEGAIKDLDVIVIGEGPPFPPVYKLAASLKLQLNPLNSMEAKERKEITLLLNRYLREMEALELEDNVTAEQLAAIEKGNQAAQRIAEAATTAQVAAVPSRETKPRKVALAGGSISPEGYESAASACCIAVDATGKKFVVTADYLFPSSLRAMDSHPQVLSPAAVDGGTTPIGRFDRIYRLKDRGVGIALIRLDDDVEVKNTIPGIGNITGMVENPQHGDRVTLFGRTSQARSGKVVRVNVTVDQVRQTAAPKVSGLLGVERISSPGDGGAPVVDQHGRLVGMAYLRTEKESLILPLADFFKDLKLTLVQD